MTAHRLQSVADRVLQIAAVILVLALLASVMAGVISRQLNRAVPWSDELAQHLLVWTGFVGIVIASSRRSHIRINVFIDLLPRGARLIVEALVQSAVIGLAASLLIWGYPLIARNWDIEWVSLPLPSGLLYVPIPITAAALILHALAALSDVIRGRLPGDPTPGKQPT